MYSRTQCPRATGTCHGDCPRQNEKDAASRQGEVGVQCYRAFCHHSGDTDADQYAQKDSNRSAANTTIVVATVIRSLAAATIPAAIGAAFHTAVFFDGAFVPKALVCTAIVASFIDELATKSEAVTAQIAAAAA